jgi:sulfatase maturation enzyme AslB (radical SAM superfamily)
MTNKFCRFLSNGYSISLSGNKLITSPCCWFNGEIPFDQIDSGSFNDITDWTTSCAVCHKQELAGQFSFRQASFDIIPNDAKGVVALDINIDFNCNAACVTCGPEASSLWAKQINKHTTIYISPNSEYQQKLDEILSKINLTNLRRIKFFGGEPLLTASHMQVLAKIPHPENVSIWYTTNASILPKQDVISMWERFHLVFFEASIDGVGDQFDYIRWPLRWDHITENLIKLKECAPSNLLFRINHTLNPFNIYYYDNFENWINQNLKTNRLGDPTEINIHPCWGSWDLSRTPKQLRSVIHNKYGNHKVTAILDQTDQLDYQPIIDFTATWDPIRKNYWQDIFPDIATYF